MATQPFDSRLTAVEQTLAELARKQDRTQAQIDQFAAETRAFAERITAAAERLDDRMERTDRRMQEMAARSDRQWGELANKMGTLTEDIVLPGIPTVFRTFFGEEGRVDLAVRVRRHHPADAGRSEEYDAVVSGGDVLLIAESKSTLRPEHIGEFRDKLARSREFLPEAAGKRVVGLLASFYLEPGLVTAGERQGLIMVGLGTGLLQVLNTPGFVPRAF
jgi:hypothetical protein